MSVRGRGVRCLGWGGSTRPSEDFGPAHHERVGLGKGRGTEDWIPAADAGMTEGMRDFGRMRGCRRGALGWIGARLGRRTSGRTSDGIVMGYAVFATGGKQYRVSPGDVIEVDRLDAEASGSMTFDDVLLVSGEDGVQVGQPTVDGASIEASVLEHVRGRKIRIFTYRASKRRRRRMGHRQELTRVRIDSISAQPA